jgi:hypothetical protein
MPQVCIPGYRGLDRCWFFCGVGLGRLCGLCNFSRRSSWCSCRRYRYGSCRCCGRNGRMLHDHGRMCSIHRLRRAGCSSSCGNMGWSHSGFRCSRCGGMCGRPGFRHNRMLLQAQQVQPQRVEVYECRAADDQDTNQHQFFLSRTDPHALPFPGKSNVKYRQPSYFPLIHPHTINCLAVAGNDPAVQFLRFPYLMIVTIQNIKLLDCFTSFAMTAF